MRNVIAAVVGLALAAGAIAPARADVIAPNAPPPPQLPDKKPDADKPDKAKDDDEGEVKLSMPTEEDRVAWTRSGFRLGLAVAYGDFHGLRGAPNGRFFGFAMHAGIRLDRDWSLMSTFEYGRVSKAGGLSGLRFKGTIDPTWHVTPHLALAIGVGFGGIVEGRTGRPDAEPISVEASYTFTSAEMPLPSCSGVGAAGLARIEYGWVLGPRASTAVMLEGEGQYTQCTQNTGILDTDTAQPVVRTQYWPHIGFELSWGMMWR